MFRINNKVTRTASLTLYCCLYCQLSTYFTPFSSFSNCWFWACKCSLGRDLILSVFSRLWTTCKDIRESACIWTTYRDIHDLAFIFPYLAWKQKYKDQTKCRLVVLLALLKSRKWCHDIFCYLRGVLRSPSNIYDEDSLHKKWSFPWRISSVNCGFGHIY